MTTRNHAPGSGSLLDPRVEEATWYAWQLTSASPQRLTNRAAVDHAAAVFDRICETSWLSGRISLITQIEVDANRRLTVSFAAGVFGATGTTADEAEALSHHAGSRLNDPGLPFRIQPIEPMRLLDPPGDQLAHDALIRQRHQQVTLDETTDLNVLSRFNPPADPWSSVARLLVQRHAPTRVRATVLPVELPFDARLELEDNTRQVSDVATRFNGPSGRSTRLQRAIDTVTDLQASFATPVMCAELAVTSSAPLPELFLRAVATSFTSEHDVQHRDGHLQVAGQQRLLGGFELDRASDALAAAHRDGVPLYGGHQPAQLRDLVTFFENPLGWPLPIAGPVPTLPTSAVDGLPVPAGFDHGVRIGLGLHDEVVHLPTSALDRHLASFGAPGTGKTTVLIALATERLRTGAGFAYLDPHGQAAKRLRDHATALDSELTILDPEDPATYQLELVPRLREDGQNLEVVEQAAADLAEAIASTLSDPDFAGPVWERNVRALIIAAAAHGVELAEAIGWLDDEKVLRQMTKHPALPDWAVSALLGVLRTTGSDGARTRDWLVSKLTPFTSRKVRRILAAPGHGVDADTLLACDAPLVADLSSLARYDVALVGNLIISSLLRAAFSRDEEPAQHYALLVDEAHRYHAAAMERVHAEGRKFALSLAIATQSLRQLAPGLRDAMSGAAITIAFRQSPDSAARLSPLINVPATSLTDLPDLTAYVHQAGKGTCTVKLDPYAEVAPSAAPARGDRDPDEPRPTPATRRSVPDDDARPSDPDPGSFYASWVARRLGN